MSALEDRLRRALAAKADGVTPSMLAAAHVPAEAEVLSLPPHRSHRSRRVVAIAVAVAAMVLVAVGAAAVRQATNSSVDPAHVRPRSAVPWDQVGPGWVLELVAPMVNINASHTLYMVDPSGQQWYRICDVGREFYFGDVAWSRDTGRAFAVQNQVNGAGIILDIDLHRGRLHSFTIPGAWSSVQPVDSGRSLLLSNPWTATVKVDLTGRVETRFPGKDHFGSAPSPDGTKLAMGTESSLEIFDLATGKLLQTLPAPTGYHYCLPNYWTTIDAAVIAQCERRGAPNPGRALSFPLDRSRPPTPLAVPAIWSDLGLIEGGVRVNHSVLIRYATRVGQAGSARIAVPAPLRQGDWELTWLSDNDFLAELITPEATDHDTMLKWDVLSGKVVDLHTNRPPGTTIFWMTQWQPAHR
ncbi:MAG TPA: hypothetical protein VMB79_12415 [Jatrophihabitans sp.]|nr:hypothetical protein [Jatrophihabitans sp.]